MFSILVNVLKKLKNILDAVVGQDEKLEEILLEQKRQSVVLAQQTVLLQKIADSVIPPVPGTVVSQKIVFVRNP
jgi:hypothetical protein